MSFKLCFCERFHSGPAQNSNIYVHSKCSKSQVIMYADDVVAVSKNASDLKEVLKQA